MGKPINTTMHGRRRVIAATGTPPSAETDAADPDRWGKLLRHELFHIWCLRNWRACAGGGTFLSWEEMTEEDRADMTAVGNAIAVRAREERRS